MTSQRGPVAPDSGGIGPQDDSGRAVRTRVVIVHYGQAALTDRAVASVLAGSVLPGAVVVVDNGPAEYVWAAAAAAAAAPVPVRIVRPGTNTGFAGGVAAGLAAFPEVGWEYLWLLNNDALAGRDALSELLATMARQSGPALVSSLVIDEDTGAAWFERPRYLPWRLESRSMRLQGDGGSPDVDVGRSSSWRSVAYLPGCSLLVPDALMVELGGFDSAFFVYGEDVDLAIRAGRLGCTLVLSRRSVVRHRAGSAARPALREQMLAESGVRLTRRYYAWLLPIAIAGGLVTAMKRVVFTRQGWWMSARLKGYWAGLRA